MTIRWIVNGKIEATQISDLLKNKKTTFVPFVEFYFTNSAV